MRFAFRKFHSDFRRHRNAPRTSDVVTAFLTILLKSSRKTKVRRVRGRIVRITQPFRITWPGPYTLTIVVYFPKIGFSFTHDCVPKRSEPVCGTGGCKKVWAPQCPLTHARDIFFTTTTTITATINPVVRRRVVPSVRSHVQSFHLQVDHAMGGRDHVSVRYQRASATPVYAPAVVAVQALVAEGHHPRPSACEIRTKRYDTTERLRASSSNRIRPVTVSKRKH